MKITSQEWTKEKGWIKTQTIYYGLLSFRFRFSFCFGIGYFTSYENDEILVKTAIFPFVILTETYMKLKQDEKDK